MSGYGQFYEEAARAVAFDGFGRISHKFAGVKSFLARGHDQSKDRAQAWIEAAEEVVWPLLYQWHYLRERRTAPDRREALPMRDREDPEFVARLSEANHSTGVFDPGWRVAARGPEGCLCEKDGLQIQVDSAALDPQGTDESVAIRFPAERRNWLPLYYCIAGGNAITADLRIYFNVKPARAAFLLRMLSRLHGANTSYQFKVLNHPRGYTRPDAAVLYVLASASRVCRAMVDQMMDQIMDQIMDQPTAAFSGFVPALTRRIYPGIAVADEPAPLNGRRLVSASTAAASWRVDWRAHAGGCRAVTQAVDAICREFTLENLDPARPYAGVGDRAAAANF